jgi:hypothetical protein
VLLPTYDAQTYTEENTMATLVRFSLVLFALTLASPACGDNLILKIDCTRGQTINDALTKAEPGDTILVRGACTDRAVTH